MFTPVEREQLRDELIKTAHADNDVVGAALVGSAATGREDAWSDIDLALQVGHGADPAVVASRWTAQFYDRHGAAHHVDVIAGGVLYRVFLLASSLQIDVSFWPKDQFRATEPGFTLLFGTPLPATEPADPNASREIGMAWLYALHSRSAIARHRFWQATMMLDHLRDQLLVLASLRHGLNPHHGREADLLPASVLDPLRQARAASMAESELARSHAALVRGLADEVAFHDRELSTQLNAPLDELARAGY
ncbi:nucleotidyltransferase domain-containing protein [Natronosporangium hydrolyticum]|uniref:Nucleotidyltransferase domain-containing protein n=1 Tax=Natronosporangium hydrolyticum TaxID=2811111 RepID=A0A895YJP7_9ACTN|nr:nucleotidyltransferase domain-containing protein [Natronosporangium hydrolyticum]QSB14836.1 nucleotidyltransferase domain-containing protein [Natronosporangium hydrolyticum]